MWKNIPSISSPTPTLFNLAIRSHFCCRTRLQSTRRPGINTLSAVPDDNSSISALSSVKTRTFRSDNMKLVVICLMSVVAVALARPQQQEPIPIVNQEADISPEGAYKYSYETGNGIKADEVGSLQPADNPEDGNVVVVEGSYTYTGEDGVVYTVTYKADKEGFKATGDHIPKK